MASNSDSVAMNLWNREKEMTHHYFLHYLSILLIHYFACRIQLGVTQGLLTLEITYHTYTNTENSQHKIIFISTNLSYFSPKAIKHI